MPKTTKTLYRINLRVNQPREKLLEEVCQMALEQDVQLDPKAARTVWWGIERVKWAYELLKEQAEKERVIKTKMGSLKC